MAPCRRRALRGAPARVRSPRRARRHGPRPGFRNDNRRAPHGLGQGHAHATASPRIQRGSARRRRRGEGARASPRSPRSPPPRRCARRRSQNELMPPPSFVPPWWLRGAHAQTIYGALLTAAPRIVFRRERWDTPDGDFVDVDFVDGPEGAPWLHLFHGLEGSSDSPYARMLMHYVIQRGWRGSILNFRGRSGESNRPPRAYHSGESDEIDWVLRRFRERLPQAPVFVVGVSLGGNALAKWLGENAEAAREIVDRVAVVSAPVDLMAAGDALEKCFALLYARHFLPTLNVNSLDKV